MDACLKQGKWDSGLLVPIPSGNECFVLFAFYLVCLFFNVCFFWVRLVDDDDDDDWRISPWFIFKHKVVSLDNLWFAYVFILLFLRKDALCDLTLNWWLRFILKRRVVSLDKLWFAYVLIAVFKKRLIIWFNPDFC